MYILILISSVSTLSKCGFTLTGILELNKIPQTKTRPEIISVYFNVKSFTSWFPQMSNIWNKTHFREMFKCLCFVCKLILLFLNKEYIVFLK